MEPDPFAIFIVLLGMMLTILGVYGIVLGEYVWFGRRFRQYVVPGKPGAVLSWLSMASGVFSVVFAVAYIFGYTSDMIGMCPGLLSIFLFPLCVFIARHL